MLKIGDRLPEFSLQDDAGDTVTHRELSVGAVVLYFYPKDDTPGCIRQACAFRDGLDAFRERGAALYGVSADDIESHLAFKAKFGLTFPLLADTQHALCDAVGVWGEQTSHGHRFEGVARTTLVLRDGVVTTVFPSVDVVGHAERVLAAL